MPTPLSMTNKPRALMTLAGAAGAALALPISAFWHGFDEVPWVFWLHSTALLATLFFAARPHTGSQILARAFWWQTALFGTVLFLFENGADSRIGSLMAAGAFVALAGAGKRGLVDADGSHFAPVAFRGSLITALVLALADTQALLLYGGIGFEKSVVGTPLRFVLCGLVMATAVYGLYRLKLWGVVLNIVANLTIAGLVLTGGLDIDSTFGGALVVTALVQLLIPVPMIRAMRRRVTTSDSADLVSEAEQLRTEFAPSALQTETSSDAPAAAVHHAVE